MCTYTLLVHNSSGYMIQCKECGHFQLAFGTTEVTMHEDELRAFYNILHQQQYPLEDRGALHRKTIRISIASGAAFALTPFETKELIDTIDEAMATLEVKNLLCVLK